MPIDRTSASAFMAHTSTKGPTSMPRNVNDPATSDQLLEQEVEALKAERQGYENRAAGTDDADLKKRLQGRVKQVDEQLAERAKGRGAKAKAADAAETADA